MKVTDFIAKFLYIQGVTHVFELSGGMITHLLDSLFRLNQIQIVTMHHEQSAAFAADAFGRIKGVPGVALATSGPGATNLLTGIGSCYFDSVPAIFITGQVNQQELKANRNIRQLGFQETDIESMAKPITKATFQIKKPEEIPAIFAKAFEIALSGRQGPVLIDLPMNIQRMEVADDIVFNKVSSIQKSKPFQVSFWKEFYNKMFNAKRPVILAGRGVVCDKAENLLKQFAERYNIPVVSSLLALDVLDYSHPLRAGFIGSYGNRWGNIALGNSDFLLVLGARLDIRQTGADVRGFEQNKEIYHVDLEEGEINNRITCCNEVISSVKNFLSAAIEFNPYNIEGVQQTQGWINEIGALKQLWPDTNEIQGIEGINPNSFLHNLSESAKNYAAVFLADVGSHQMWAAQSLELYDGQKFLTSGGMGAMGYALPAAIGASIAVGNKPVVVISGDGGFQLNIQELQTIVRNKLPVKLVVMNNRVLGMIRQFQDSYFNSQYQSTMWGYSTPDFTKIAAAYGIDSFIVNEEGEINKGLLQMWKNPTSPFLLEVKISPFANAYPKIAFGRPITEMEPFAKPLDMEGT